MMSNRYRGTIYIGVTSDLAGRAFAHKQGKGSEFTTRYGLTRLVYIEPHDNIANAIAREKTMKKWRRAWKFRLIEEQNPDWLDLFDTINA